MDSKSRPLFCIAFLLLALTTTTWFEPKAILAQETSCLSRLAPCLNFLNGTQDPPRSCCDPLKSVIESDAQCLCSLVSNKGASQAEQAGININEAQNLPGRCGQRVNPLSCLTYSSGSKNSGQNSAAKSIHVSLGVIVILVLSITALMLWAST